VLVACGIDPLIAQTSVRFTFGRTPRPDGAPAQLAALVAASVQAVARP
jgi:cysteine desulfurase